MREARGSIPLAAGAGGGLGAAPRARGRWEEREKTGVMQGWDECLTHERARVKHASHTYKKNKRNKLKNTYFFVNLHSRYF